MKRMSLVLVLIFCLNFVSCKNENSKRDKYVTNVEIEKTQILNISVEEFKQFVDSKKGVVLDVRTSLETSSGYIEGAEFLNYFDSNFESKLQNKFSKIEPVYIYCRSGKRSEKAAKICIKNGYQKVYSLIGGMKAWKTAGFKTVKNN